jgi:hypothetical protein
MTPRTLAALLADAGYSLSFHAHVWTECFVTRASEQWVGRGHSQDAALEDAVAQMLPSELARAGLRRAALGGPAESAHDEKPALAESTHALDDLLHRIGCELPAFAVLAPAWQRLQLTAWICRARALGEGDKAKGKVGPIASRLTELAKVYWPGAVRALHASARPADARVYLGAGEAAPRGWSEAAERAEQQLRALALDATTDGGWADTWQRAPAPAEPEDELARVASVLDTILGAPQLGPAILDHEAVEGLVTAALTLRWLRGSVRHPQAWGVAMGRVRRVAAGLADVRLRQALDAAYRPLQPWAALVREVPSAAPFSGVGTSPADARPASTAEPHFASM